MQVACGYNPNFLDFSLKIPSEVSLIELGQSAYLHLVDHKENTEFSNYEGAYSLHISRSAITESADHQARYLENQLPSKLHLKNTISLGFHLCGYRDSNIGKYGFSSHYIPNKSSIQNASSFISRVQDKYQLPVWIENANFYSSNSSELIEAITSANKICATTNAQQIIDVAHLVINASNLGIDPTSLIGFIDWSTVKELHLSGIITGRDGMLHDGHSVTVHERVWRMLNLLMKLGLIKSDQFVNIEHSDSVWVKNSTSFYADFERLKKLSIEVSQSENSEIEQLRESYAISYLKKSLLQSVGNYESIASFLETDSDSLFSNWIEFVKKCSRPLVLTEREEDHQNKSIHFLKSFSEYIDVLQK